MAQSTRSNHARRRNQIAEVVKSRGSARIDDLADQFGVSTMTIHRDLDHLHTQGLIRKVRSGAEAPPSEAFERNIELRKTLNNAEKRAVALAGFDWASERVKMQAVALDDSTTALAALPRLVEALPLTVVTNFLPLINELSAHPQARINAVGGDYAHEFSSFIGPQAVRSLRDVHCDVLFMSVPSVTRGSCFHPSSHAAELKRALIDAAELRVLLVDHSKFQRRAVHRIADLAEFDAVVVDDGIDSADLESLHALGEGGPAVIVVPLEAE